MEYTFEKLPAPEQIQKLFASVNWESAQYPEALVRGISQSQSLLTVWDGAQLAGLMTAISDSSMNVFFPYLLIEPGYQGAGIGREMVKQMMDRYAHIYRKILVCDVDKAGFYEKCGMECRNDQRPMLRIDPPVFPPIQ
ncbi:MAG: GNAT family N-acetyltransferase [Ruminococcus callidus]|nr:GNAT family N-acetyltransferase [Ruminococcus callidus]